MRTSAVSASRLVGGCNLVLYRCVFLEKAMPLKPATLPGPFYLNLLLVGLATFAVHEFCHWGAGVLLGYEMVITPNRVYATSPTSSVHAQLISFAGPFVTYLQALIGYVLVTRRQAVFGFALLYMAFYMRLIAALVSVIQPNDEARISEGLGMGTWTLPILVVLVLFALVYVASRHLKLSARDQIFCYLTASTVIAIVVGIDAAFFM